MAPPFRANSAALEMCVTAQNLRKVHKTPISAFKVIDLCGNWEPVHDFPLVINSNLGPILHR